MVTFLFGISMGEIIIVFLVILLLFGANKIPEFAKMLGKGLNEFRKATEDLKREFNENTNDLKDDLAEARKYINEQGQEIKEDIQRAGKEVKEDFEKTEKDAETKGHQESEVADGEIDETSRNVYGISHNGKRDEAGIVDENFKSGDSFDEEKNNSEKDEK